MSEQRWAIYVRDMIECCGKVRDAAAGGLTLTPKRARTVRQP